MPQFQVIAIVIFFAAVLVNWLVFSGTTFNVGFTPILAIAFLLLAIGIIFWVFFTPHGKAFARNYNNVQQQKAIAEREYLKQAQQAFKKDIEFIRQNSNSIKQDPSSQKLATRMLDHLKKEVSILGMKNILFNSLNSEEKRSTIKLLLSNFPESSQIQNFAFEQIQKGLLPSNQAYTLALEVLEENPSESKAKQFVLQVGRWHFGKLRGGKLTIYDEQAIQNDIQVRSR